MKRNTIVGPRKGRAPFLQEDVLADDDLPPLTRAQIREIDRRVKDSDDRTRYLLRSAFTRTFVLYYNVSDDVYANSPGSATLFKRRKAAVAIQRLVKGRVEIVPCRVDRRGRLVVGSIRVPRKRAWMPRP